MRSEHNNPLQDADSPAGSHFEPHLLGFRRQGMHSNAAFSQIIMPKNV